MCQYADLNQVVSIGVAFPPLQSLPPHSWDEHKWFHKLLVATV